MRTICTPRPSYLTVIPWCMMLCALLLSPALSHAEFGIKTKKKAKVMEYDMNTGIVVMGSPYLKLQKPKVDWGQARKDAAAYCQKYREAKRAEPVGPTRKYCMTRMGSTCVRYAIAGNYQCI